MTKNASGNSRQTLQVNDLEYELDDVEVAAIGRFLEEMRRTRYWKHETWCDPKEHKKAAEGAELDETPCVGRMIAVGRVNGWWHQDAPGAEPRFFVDSYGGWDASVKDLRVIEDALSDAKAPQDQLLDLVVTAQGVLEHGIPAGEQS